MSNLTNLKLLHVAFLVHIYISFARIDAKPAIFRRPGTRSSISRWTIIRWSIVIYDHGEPINTVSFH